MRVTTPIDAPPQARACSNSTVYARTYVRTGGGGTSRLPPFETMLLEAALVLAEVAMTGVLGVLHRLLLALESLLTHTAPQREVVRVRERTRSLRLRHHRRRPRARILCQPRTPLPLVS
jgi:hypothetical protein